MYKSSSFMVGLSLLNTFSSVTTIFSYCHPVSWATPSSHHNLGLPILRLLFWLFSHRRSLEVISSASIFAIWLAHLNFLNLIQFMIGSSSYNAYSSLLCLRPVLGRTVFVRLWDGPCFRGVLQNLYSLTLVPLFNNLFLKCLLRPLCRNKKYISSYSNFYLNSIDINVLNDCILIT